MKGDWKARAEYKTLQERHVPILTRCKPTGQQLGTGPMVVVWSENGPTPGGHFYPCPGSPIFFGNHQFGMMVHDTFDEWMDIPE